ncbi:RNA-binding protein CP29B chloroplastic [Bienertia sinuspersici]
MATTTPTIQSSLTSPKTSIKSCLTTKNLVPDNPFLVRIGYSSKKYCSSTLISHYYCCTNSRYMSEPITVSYNSQNGRARRRVAATVAEEEAVETEEEATQSGESSGGSEEVEVNNNNNNNNDTKLYFGNLPYHCDSAQLAGIVQQYGTPELVEVLYDRQTGKSRGFAFVTMSSIEDCNAVIQNLDGSEYGGRFLRVNLADKPTKREPLYPETEHKLFVGNLSWSVTTESLYQAFQQYGNVVGARVLYDGETGKSRGYGFVSYATRSEMENALASLNEMELEGRAMRVSLAQGKKS